MQMREATLIWPPVSCYYGNDIKTTKCLKRNTFIPVSLWSSQEISIPGNRRAHRGKQLCIWKAALAAWTKMGFFWGGLGEWEKGNNHDENIYQQILSGEDLMACPSLFSLCVSVSSCQHTYMHVHVNAQTYIFCLHLSLFNANIKNKHRCTFFFISSSAECCMRAKQRVSYCRCKWVIPACVMLTVYAKSAHVHEKEGG